MAVKLTEGAVVKMLSGLLQPTDDVRPVLQVMNIRTNQLKDTGGGNKEQERFWITLSDGSFFGKMKLFFKLNHLVTSKQINKGSVVRLNSFSSTALPGCHMFVNLHDLDVIIEKCDPIGAPNRFIPEMAGSIPPSNIAPEPSKSPKLAGDDSPMEGLSHKALMDRSHHYSVLAQTHTAHLAERYFAMNKALEIEQARVKELEQKVQDEEGHRMAIEAQVVAERKAREEQVAKLQGEIAKALERLYGWV